METSLQRDLKHLQRQKLKAQENSDLTEEAKLCNAAGELLAQHGYYEKAVREHKQEVQLSEAVQDKVGAAIAHRKVGECLCGLGKYKDALFHQNLHLELAKSAKNLVEEQRALATIGRTWFVHSDSVTELDEVDESLLEAQAAYLKSLSVCDKLRDSVPDKELLEMRSRLYLNLGLIYDSRDDQARACSFMEKALFIARDQTLKETEYKCLYSIGAIKAKSGQIACALRSFEEALQVARKNNKKFDEADALEQLGQVLLRLGEFSAGKRALKGAYKISKARLSDDISSLKSSLVSSIKGIKLKKKHERLSELPTEEQIKLLENLGDLYCKVKAFHKALDFYKAELQLARSVGKPPKVLSSICVSLAITYSDLKCPEDAIKCYMEELDMMHGNYTELCDTWCNVANVHENAKHEYDKIEHAYQKALECAVHAGSVRTQLRVHRCLADTQKNFGLTAKYEESRSNVKSLEEAVGIEDDEEEEEGQAAEEPEDNDEVLIESELHLPESDEEDNDDDEQTTCNSTRRQPNRSKTVHKVNEKGETPLHRAAIAGDVHLTKELLEKGACVNVRDYCGWQPIHEASNHGHAGIVAVLLNMGADANDAGGSHCRGITPLHDAAINGHVQVVKLLVSRGAAVNHRNNDGETALDAVSKVIKNDEQENGEDTEVEIGRKKVGQFLRQAVKFGPQQQQQQQPEMKRRNLIQDQDDSAPYESEEERRKVLGIGESSEEEDSEASAVEDSERVLHRNRTSFRIIHEDHPQATEVNNLETSSMDVDDTMRAADPVSCSSNREATCRLPYHDPVDSVHSLNDDLSDRLSGDDDSTYSSMDEDCVEVSHADDGDSHGNATACAQPSVGSNRTSHAPALLPVSARNKGHCDGNWLIDDLAPRKRRRQSKLTATFQRTGTAGSGSREKRSVGSKISRTRSRNSVASTTRPRQTRIGVNREVTTTRSEATNSITAYEVSLRHSSVTAFRLHTPLSTTGPRPSGRTAEVHEPISRGTSSVHGPSSTGTASVHGPSSTGTAPVPPMRVRVRVQGKSFLIPCPTLQGGETIGWLADQASLRYFSSSGLRPVLALQTSEGASLSSEDNITDLLSTNEEVVGCVESWDLPPLADRYRTACSSAGKAVRNDIIQLFNAEPQLSTLSLPNNALRPGHAMPLFRALQCHDRLVKLLLPGNRLGDAGLQHLASAITSLPSLAVLNVQANAVSAVGLSYITDVLAARESTLTGTNQESGVLAKLEELDVAFNPLGNTVDTSLAVLMRRCPHLVTLNLDSCSLTDEMLLRRKQFTEALRGSHLQRLTVAHNSLGTPGVMSLLSSLPVASLHHLDLTSTMTQDGHSNDQTAVESLLNFLNQDECCVQTLSLADCHLRDGDLEVMLKAKRMTHGVHTLDLSCNDIGQQSVPSLTRLLSNSENLAVLNLAGNEKLGNKAMETLSHVAGSKIQTLNLSSCGIKSPLEGQSVHVIRNLSSNIRVGTSLRELELSHNLLSSEDKQQLADDWDIYSEGTKSLSRLDGSLCVLYTTSS